MTKYHHFAILTLQNASFTHVRVPARALSLYILSLLPPLIFDKKTNKTPLNAFALRAMRT